MTIRGDFATTTFGWKTGSVESKTISVSNDTASFSLDLKDWRKSRYEQNSIYECKGKWQSL